MHDRLTLIAVPAASSLVQAIETQEIRTHSRVNSTQTSFLTSMSTLPSQMTVSHMYSLLSIGGMKAPVIYA